MDIKELLEKRNLALESKVEFNNIDEVLAFFDECYKHDETYILIFTTPGCDDSGELVDVYKGYDGYTVYGKWCEYIDIIKYNLRPRRNINTIQKW